MPFADLPDCRLYFDEIDLVAPWLEERPTILFHHGLGMTHEMWCDWLPALIERYRIIRFDIRGHGRSTWPGPAAASGLAEFVRDLIGVADAAGAGRFHFIGESLGGTVGLQAGLDHPERFLTLTISNAAHRGQAIGVAPDDHDFIRNAGMDAWSARLMRGRFHPSYADRAVLAWFERAQASIHPELALKIRDALLATDLSGEVGRLAMPVLLINGNSSPFIPVSMTADLYARLPDSEMTIVPRARHAIPVSHGGVCAGIVRAFLDRRGAGAPVSPRGGKT